MFAYNGWKRNGMSCPIDAALDVYDEDEWLVIAEQYDDIISPHAEHEYLVDEETAKEAWDMLRHVSWFDEDEREMVDMIASELGWTHG